MKLTVCKGCGCVMEAKDTKTGKPACVTCIAISPDSGTPIEVEMPEILRCSCGSKAVLNPETGKYLVTVSIKGGWNCCASGKSRELPISAIPFVDTKHNSFYCGCFGWD